MRTRKEIESKIPTRYDHRFEEQSVITQKLILEVLLDIRERLYTETTIDIINNKSTAFHEIGVA